MSAEDIYTYLQRRGFRTFRPQRDIWLPEAEGIDQSWPTIGASILSPTHAIDRLGYIVPGHYAIQRLVLRRLRGVCYWHPASCQAYHISGFEAACWDAAHLAVAHSLPVSLGENNLWQIIYKINRKYLPA